MFRPVIRACLWPVALLTPCGALAQSATTVLPAASSTPAAVNLPPIDVIGSTPLLGAAADRNTVPASTNVLTPQDITRTGVPTLTGSLNDQIAAVNLNDNSGNPNQPDLLYRGFVASPVEGDEQGLAVYVNGARFNQPFGDTVNWDLIPSNAIARVNVESANPVFGLNALGGSVSVQMKNGFNFTGFSAEGYGGSYGTAAGLFQYGINSQNTSAYFAGNVIHQDGWRYTSSSQLYQYYSDFGWRSPTSEVHLGVLADSNSLGNPGATPVQILDVNRAQNSTAPNVVDNQYVAVNLNGTHDISDNDSIQALTYYSNFTQRLSNGLTVDAQPCTDGSGFLCNGSGNYITGKLANPITDFLNGGPYSGLGTQGTNSNAFGVSAQLQDYHDLFGRPNHIVAGLSFDGGNTTFDGNTLIGGLSPSLLFVPPGLAIAQQDLSIAPVNLATTNRYYGVFFTDQYDLTRRATLSLSGRFNAADISLYDKNGSTFYDPNGTVLNGGGSYNHFNPGAGLTYKLMKSLSVFASFAQSNRAPTPIELSCASPLDPCVLPNFFIGDPPLKQVVAQTYEVGFRGRLPQPILGAKVQWDLDFFRTNSNDDIIFATSLLNPGAGYFTNVSQTRRQGIEFNVRANSGPFRSSLSYAYVDATFQSPVLLSSPNNPAADANGDIQVVPGDKLPGVPANRVKLVVDYDVTPKWTIGGNAIYQSSQYLFGDEANLTQPVGGFFVMNLNTSYKITKNIEAFALFDNIFNAKYNTYGTYAQVAGLPAPGVPGGITNNRVLSPAAPTEYYGGIRVRF